MTSFQNFLATAGQVDPEAGKLLALSSEKRLNPIYDRRSRDEAIERFEMPRESCLRLWRDYLPWREGQEKLPGLALINHAIQLPYCFQRLDVGRHVWLPLNRKYKPLGTNWDAQWVDYYDYLPASMVFLSDPLQFEGVWEYDPRTQIKWLKNDATPANVYFGRLQRLMAKQWRPPHPGDIPRWLTRLTRKSINEAAAQVGWPTVRRVLFENGFSSGVDDDLEYLMLQIIGAHTSSSVRSTCASLIADAKRFQRKQADDE